MLADKTYILPAYMSKACIDPNISDALRPAFPGKYAGADFAGQGAEERADKRLRAKAAAVKTLRGAD